MAETYKTKADYTILRKRHQNASNGDIFENDYMTISPMDTLFSEDQDIINSDSNFKFSYRISNNLQKKHAKSGWVKTANGSEEWNLDDAISGGTISDESKIRIKPNYNSLKDFAYFGSAGELVRGTLNDVIQNFPAELYFTGEKLIDEVNKETINPLPSGSLNGCYLISNDFGINAHIDDINESEVYNPMRFLSLSYSNYNLIRNGNVRPLTGITITKINPTCQDDINGKTIATAKTNGVTFYTYLREGKFYLYYKTSSYKGIRIRPNDDVVEEYFSTIDEFEYVLLNRDSKPLYMAEFETPYETDKGNFYKKEKYIWPSKYNWNPDIESIAYENYVGNLISLAEFHDEYDSNNIWRSMTHEAIKNLDWTFTRENGDDVEDLSDIDSSKIEIFLQLYGRQFDGLKRYIDNIKYTNQITYNEKNNLPDYCLTDTVGNSGWEVKPLIATAKSEYYSDILYNNMSRGYSEVEANNNFMRNLKLNSRYIISNKGTREGIASLLGLLGIYSGEYVLNEHVAVAKGSDTEYCHFQDDNTENFKYPNAEDIIFVNKRKTSLLDDFDGDVYKGIGVREIVSESGKKYVVPWYDNGKQYDNGMYFQNNGGWGKIKSNFYPIDINVDCTPITAFSPSKIEVYEETQNYLRFASDFNTMFDFSNSVLKEGMIVYVTDISGAEANGFDSNDASHYFVLEDRDKSTLAEGWYNVKESELAGLTTKYAEKIAYLESIKESTEGNNSHTGEGYYDDGNAYIESLNSIFGGAIENNDLTQFTKDDIEKAISGYTFNIDEMTIDNDKCWYFGKEAIDGTTDWDKWSETPVNPENGASYEEPAANSIVNLKNVDITFYYPTNGDGDTIEEYKTDFKKYLLNVVLPYLEQVIPSTTIMTYDIMDKNGGTPSPSISSVTEMDSVPTRSGEDLVNVDGVIYTNVDYANGMDMIDEDNVINR